MGWQTGTGHGTGEEPAGSVPARDPRLPGFAHGGEWDACPPSAGLAAALEAIAGPDWRCPGATRDELLGLLRQWQALESWAAAGKLVVVALLSRCRYRNRAQSESGEKEECRCASHTVLPTCQPSEAKAGAPNRS